MNFADLLDFVEHLELYFVIGETNEQADQQNIIDPDEADEQSSHESVGRVKLDNQFGTIVSSEEHENREETFEVVVEVKTVEFGIIVIIRERDK